MPLTPAELEKEKARFDDRTARFAAEGYDRMGAPGFILDQSAPFAGPVLDVGTGTGLTARALAARGFDVVSVDTSANDQQVAESLTTDPELRSKIQFLLADAASLPFASGHFGAAVGVDVLHHLASGAAVLAEVARVVRLGGKIVLADFSAEGFEMVRRIHRFEGHEHPEGPVTMDWARGFLGGLGVKECSLAGDRFHRVAVLEAPAAGQAPPAFASLDRAGLLGALDTFAKSWLAHDGCWFLAAEERHGMDAAIELDTASWRRFAAAEARRIMDAFAIPAGGGLDALARALSYRMYSFVNPSRVERSPEGDVLRFYMEACRVQQTRRRKGLPDFPCRSVGEVEFDTFARTVDPRITTRCLSCPPDPGADGHCAWEFRINSGE